MGITSPTWSGASLVALDTCIFIYAIEQHPVFAPTINPLFDLLADGHLRAVTSLLTLLEVLVLPLRQGHPELAAEYRKILTESSSLQLAPIDRNVVEQAADLRARYAIKLPDALQLATAKVARADVFLTNDKMLQRCTDVNVVLLDEPR
jgi:predicted nucleic acid-binding protein